MQSNNGKEKISRASASKSIEAHISGKREERKKTKERRKARRERHNFGE